MANPAQRLAVCFDGTWNTDRSNTNVSRLFRKVADETCGCLEQKRFYDDGVGTRWGERIRGGVLGMGLDRNIRQAYAWLGVQYPTVLPAELGSAGFVQGPQLFLFGFSRGAFTARSLGGLINYLGLPKSASLPNTDPTVPLEEHPLVQEAWSLYVARPTPDERKQIAANKATGALRDRVKDQDAKADAYRKQKAVYPVRIHFLGVWDTVGALGIPRVLDYSWLPRPSNQYLFHDTQLGRCVRFGYHAAAIDEQRENYCVTLWTGKDPNTTEEVEQRWFPGAHADVGGGYEDDLLPDPPLAWIAQKAAEKGLHFVNDRGLVDPQTEQVPCSVARPPAAFDLDGREYLSPVHDSYAEFMYGLYRVLRAIPGAGGRVYRRMLVGKDGIGQSVDPTAYKKLEADASYRPPNLAQAGREDVSYHIATLDNGEGAEAARSPADGTSGEGSDHVRPA